MALRRGRPVRWTNRVEDLASWVLLAAGLLLVLFACTTGIGIHDRLVQQGRAEALHRTPTSATLLEGPDVGVPVQRRDTGGRERHLG